MPQDPPLTASDGAPKTNIVLTNSVQQSIPSDTWTRLEYDTADGDSGNEWNTTTNEFTANQAGTYLIWSNTAIDSATGGIFTDINYPGSPNVIHKSGSGGMPHASRQFDLNEGDYVFFEILHREGTTMNTPSQPQYNQAGIMGIR